MYVYDALGTLVYRYVGTDNAESFLLLAEESAGDRLPSFLVGSRNCILKFMPARRQGI